MKKEYLKIKGVITEIGELVHIQRERIPDLYKKVLTLETIDEQVLYPEVRNAKLKLLENVYENSTVEIEFSFEGSEKNGKRYNNIYINNITKL
jgi:hemerythrin superfamily protein